MMKPGFDGGDECEFLTTLESALGPVIDYKAFFRPNWGRSFLKLVDSKIQGRQRTIEDAILCPTSIQFLRFQKCLAEFDENLAEELTPSSNLANLIPAEKRPHFWRSLNKSGLNLPPLGLHPSTTYSVAVLALAAVTLISTLVWNAAPAWIWTAPLIGLIVLVAAGKFDLYILPRLFWRWAYRIPKPLDTAKGMATYLAYRDCKPDWIPTLTQKQIHSVVCLAAALEYDVSIDEITEQFSSPQGRRNNRAS